MGNHTIDCEFCGQDQRVTGEYCCEAYRAKKIREREEFDREDQKVDAFLKKYGFSSSGLGYFQKVNIRDALLRLIETKDLRER